MKRGDPVLSEEQLARAASILIGGLALFGLVGITAVRILTPGDLRPHYRLGFVLLLLGLSVVGVFAISRWPALLNIRFIPAGLALAAAGLAGASWFSGPIFSPYVDMSFLWIGMFAFLLLDRTKAFLVVGLVALMYGAQVTFQPGNFGPLTRWILVVGAVLVSGLVVGALSDHIHHLRASEHTLRLEVEDATRHLEAASRQRREFLAGMSHELRTPLNAIIGFADVLGEELFGSLTDAQESLVDKIQEAGTRLLGLVGEVLSLDERDGSAPVDPPHADRPPPDREPLTSADPRGALAFFVLVPLGLATLPHTPRDFHIAAIATIAGIGVLVDMFILLSRHISPRSRAVAHVTVVTLVVAGVAFRMGGVLSPFATMFFLWTATAASIRLSRVAAVLQLVLASVCEAVIVTFQSGNLAPVFRWEMTTGTVVVSALIIRMVVERLFEAADLEARMLVAADDTKSALEAINLHKVGFLRNVREELRWPVDDVASAASALLDGSHGALDAKQAEYARDIASAGDQLWVLITDILDLATIESGGMTLAVADVAVIDVLHDALSEYVTDAEAAGVRLDLAVEPPDARLWTDRDKLRRAVAGLVSNAVKFTPTGGLVRVHAVTDDRRIVISVADTGRGIPAEDQVRIFEGFQQGVSAMIAPGVGVGLTLARRFVELQGGKVELVSEPGVGSTFTITLPVFDRPTSALQEAPVA